MFSKVLFFEINPDAAQTFFSGSYWQSKIKQFRFVPMRSMPKEVGAMMEKSEGFGVAYPELNSTELVYEGADFVLLNYSIEVRKVPVKNLKRRVREMTAELKSKLGLETLDKEQKKEVNENAYKFELARTPETLSEYFILINKRGRWMAIDATTQKSLDKCITMLRSAFGTLPVTQLQVLDAREAFTEWVSNKAVPEDIYLGHDCKLDSLSDGALASYRKQELDCTEIHTNINNEKQVCEIGVNLKVESSGSEVLFPLVIDANLIVSSLKWKIDSEDLASEDIKSVAEGKMIYKNVSLNNVFNFVKASLVERHKGGSNEFMPTA
ncbi:recombination-associated protein RdgC (plasmid) [Shewanella xiamenensis]|uniref:Recombination-associated protein RdgC n=1 Tax=Shewanella xiamenensis TaxID=332186 RepID=A0ABT6UGH0_9GAMM|nr:recombination-associated protein RdgC [Shewanella xiamenensis]MDI5832601.1 recombination-associated protein RdgC [Shewanella xiamenensis]WHF57781.1 recombination-associated protein RdgC [Shewanella xiamenensis]